MAYYKTTDHRQATNHRPTDKSSTVRPTTDNRPTDKCFTDPPTTATDHRPNNKCSIDPPTTDLSTGPPPTHRSPTHRHYYNWPTTLWFTNLILTEPPLDQFFQQLISVHHSEMVSFITEFVKLFTKWLIKNNIDKLQILFIIPFGNWYLRIGLISIFKCFLLKNFFLFLWCSCCKTFFISLYLKKKNRVLSNCCYTGLQMSESFHKTKMGW